MSENLLLTLLLLVFGGVVGALITLIVDDRYLGRRLQAALGQRQRLQREMQVLGRQLARQQRQLADRQSQLVAARQQIQTQTADLARMNQSLTTTRQALDQLTAQWKQLQSERQTQAQTILNLRHERETLQQAIHHLEKEQIRAEARHEAACQQLLNYRDQLQQAQSRVESLQQRIEQKRKINESLTNSPGRLEIIAGIGPTYARRLREGGILTLTDLAEAEVDQLREIIKLQPWHGRNPQVWIDEAKRLLKRPPTDE
jgi:predicted flap endonuclease-1-like 5' DNA nuclease